MSVNIQIDLPDEVTAGLGQVDLSTKAKEALVMEFLREHYISQGKAAELLGLPRDELFVLTSKYHISVIDLTSAELRSELSKPLGRY